MPPVPLAKLGRPRNSGKLQLLDEGAGAMATIVVLLPTAALVGGVGLGDLTADAQPTTVQIMHAKAA